MQNPLGLMFLKFLHFTILKVLSSMVQNREGFALVCRDGPAFEAAAVAWEGLP